MKVSPSILTCDFANAKDDIKDVAPYCEYLHLDVMDGQFVPNISFGMPLVKSLRKHFNNVFDTHLMILEPIKYVEGFAKAGSDIITFHLESKDNPNEVIDKIHSLGVKAGISIKPKTDVKDLDPFLDKVELILIMSVEPGFGGQKFDPTSLDKIKYLADMKKKNGYKYEIEVDGGINQETGKMCLDAGCEVLVAGSYVFNAANREEAINSLRK